MGALVLEGAHTLERSKETTTDIAIEKYTHAAALSALLVLRSAATGMFSGHRLARPGRYLARYDVSL